MTPFNQRVLGLARDILTDRFCIDPFIGQIPQPLPQKSCTFAVPPEVLLAKDSAEDDFWRHTLEPVWCVLSMSIADEKSGACMYQPLWTIEERPNGFLTLAICTEPDHHKVADAIMAQAASRAA